MPKLNPITGSLPLPDGRDARRWHSNVAVGPAPSDGERNLRGQLGSELRNCRQTGTGGVEC
jgi:hypothetical protein